MQEKELPVPKPQDALRGVAFGKRLQEPEMYSTIELAREEIESAIHELEEYVRKLPDPAQIQVAYQPSSYRVENGTLAIHVGEHQLRRLSLECLVEARSRGFLKGSESHVTLKVRMDVNGRVQGTGAHALEYVVPKQGELESGALSYLVRSLAMIAAEENYDPVEEAGFVRAVATFTGIHRLGTAYFLWRWQMLASDVNKQLQSFLRQAKEQLGSLREKSFKKKELMDALTREKVESAYGEILACAKAAVDAHVERVRIDLDAYRESFRQSLDAFRRSEEVDYIFQKAELEGKAAVEIERYRKKISSLKKREQALDEREEKQLQKLKSLEDELKARYAKKEAILDQKLSGHRAKVDSESGRILQTLDVLFADVAGDDYCQKVDHDLRLFYAKIWHEELRRCEHMSIGDSIALMNALRTKCLPARKRPQGRDLRWLYAGMRAVMDYITTHAVSMNDVLNKLSALEFEKKPNVETILEKTLMYDFNMNEYLDGLHKNGAKSRKDLGIE